MGDATTIEWTDATWNPIAGCAVVSPGCTHCYAMREAHRLGSNLNLRGKYTGLTRVVNGHPVWTGDVRLHEAALLQPLKWKRPRRIFVNSMSDLFHAGVPDDTIDRVFAVMALARHHTFQVLTKRSFRMREYFAAPTRRSNINGAIWSLLDTPLGSTIEHGGKWSTDLPLPNVWLGVSAENQDYAEMRIPDLLATPAAIRFASCEPLLGPINLRHLTQISGPVIDAVAGEHWHQGAGSISSRTITGTPLLDWVIAGGESGPNARPMHPDWPRALRDQCQAADVPFFMKQMSQKAAIPADLLVREFPHAA